jgi:glycosyltransferase involved in cell wall biosynthesis
VEHPLPIGVPSTAGERPDVDVVVPVWNEELRIGATLAALVAHAATMPASVSVTVVDNGSVDRTAEVVDACAEQAPNVTLRLLGCSRQGKGAAVRRGVVASRGRWVGFCDADLATPPETLDVVLTELRAGHPVVIGSRRCAGAELQVRQPLGRRIGSAGFRLLTRSLVGGVADTQCGFKFFTAEAARAVFGRAVVDGFSFDVEVLGIAQRLGLPVREIPVVWSDQQGSSFSPWTHGRRVLAELRTARRSIATAA